MTRLRSLALAAVLLTAPATVHATSHATSHAASHATVPCPVRTEPLPLVARPWHPGADSTLVTLHASGQRFADFVAATKARREGWLRLADSAEVAEPLLARARAVGGAWRLLVVAVDTCGDSMNTVPFVARVADAAGVDLRIVLPAAGRAVQEAHRSLDGRVATPTFILLDANGAEAGCIVEQPRPLREWSAAMRPRVSLDSVHSGIRAFYARDHGAAMATETVELLEAAAAGRPVCEMGQAGR
jgi:hypothetical protein